MFYHQGMDPQSSALPDQPLLLTETSLMLLMGDSLRYPSKLPGREHLAGSKARMRRLGSFQCKCPVCREEEPRSPYLTEHNIIVFPCSRCHRVSWVLLAKDTLIPSVKCLTSTPGS